MNDKLRFPKLYDGDPRRFVVVDDVGYHRAMRWHDIVDGVFRAPYSFRIVPWAGTWTITDAIRSLTGYSVIWEQARLPFWSWSHLDAPYTSNARAAIGLSRPAHVGNRGSYYYLRDLITASLPRRRCLVCGRCVAVTRWNPEKAWSRWYPAFAEIATGLYVTESDPLWREIGELLASACSRTDCLEAAVTNLRREVNHIKELRQWAQTGRQSLREVKALLRQGARARHEASRSQTRASSPREISAT